MMRIQVLVHENDTEFSSGEPGYLLELLLNEWRRSGNDVRIARGVDRPPISDLLIPHMDLTVIPDEYFRFMQNCPSVVNARVRDTSKRKISTNLLQLGDDYAGPVIVKTDRNYGGLPEANIRAGSGLARIDVAGVIKKTTIKICRKLTGMSPWRYIDSIPPDRYPVFSNLDVVPRGVFRNSSLVVEKYIPEMDGDDYLLRYYYFFRDREVCLLLRSKESIVKFSNAFQIEEIPVHPDLREIRHKFGFDYGKFDYFIHDGRAVVFDANKSPGHTAGHAGGRHEDLYGRMVRYLAAGIDSTWDGHGTLEPQHPNPVPGAM